MLLIPCIELRDGRCDFGALRSDDPCGHLFDDPIQMSKLWRLQNAKALHIIDRNALEGDRDWENLPVIRAIGEAVAIPLQVERRPESIADLDHCVGAGVYRQVIPPDAALYAEAANRFGNSRFVVRIPADASSSAATRIVSEFGRLGCCRFIYGDEADGRFSPKLAIEIAHSVDRAKLTVCGAFSDFASMSKFVGEAPPTIDSAVLGQPLYRNAFPCQRMWCWHDLGTLDLDRPTTASLRSTQ